MRASIYNRKGIPFFHDKTTLEFKQDIYERYDEMVIRQTALHLVDKIWDKIPFQPVFDFAEKHSSDSSNINILEIGCGVGKWIASLSTKNPNSICWGVDYSYQMLKRANECWVEGKEISIDLMSKGLGQHFIKGEQIPNLKFGLAKAEKLPFEDNSQDLVVSSFLLDRLEEPRKGLEEMHRVLKASGQLILISPLNFNTAENWKMYFPSCKLSDVLVEIGFEIIEWKEDMIIDEPMDARGNVVQWSCLAFVVSKRK